MQYLLLFHGNNGYTNVHQYYVYTYIVCLVAWRVLWHAAWKSIWIYPLHVNTSVWLTTPGLQGTLLTTSQNELNSVATDKQSGISSSKCQVSQLTCCKQVGGQILQISEDRIWNTWLWHRRDGSIIVLVTQDVCSVNRRYIASDRIANESERWFTAVQTKRVGNNDKLEV
jgi:hypothetical protein